MKIQKRKNNTPIVISVVLFVVLAIGGYFAYAYTQGDVWPFSKTESEKQSLPKLEERKDTPDQSTPSEESTPTSTPTKTEGKSPTQYEGETLDDTPEYNNEQFRIPEEN